MINKRISKNKTTEKKKSKVSTRTKYNDWDFSADGRTRQADRMRHLADGVTLAGKIAIADFICPTEETRKNFNADFTIWMDTIDAGKYDDTNKMFETPTKCDFIVTKWYNDTHDVLNKIITNRRK